MFVAYMMHNPNTLNIQGNVLCTFPFCIDTGVDKVGLNGKVNNMMKPYKMAKHNLLLISDSNIKSKVLSYID